MKEKDTEKGSCCRIDVKPFTRLIKFPHFIHPPDLISTKRNDAEQNEFAGADYRLFFGIEFTGHPDLRRILNVDDLDVFPMRKEYKLEDGTRTDKDDRFFGRDGYYGQSFETRLID